MEGISVGQWLSIGGEYALWLAGVIVALCAAGVYLHKIYKMARRPHDEHEKRIAALEDHNEKQDGYLKVDKEKLDDLETDVRLVMSGVMQIITHTLDGNHIEKLRAVRDDMQQHLIEKR